MGKSLRRSLRSAIYAAVLLSALGHVSAALAQSDESGPALSAEEVSACLCLQQEIDELRRETELQGALRQERKAELSQIDQQIERNRVVVDVGNPEAVKSLQQLVARQQMLRDLLRNDIRQSQQASIERLNARVATYNEKCTTRPMFKLEVERAQANLQCPAL
ncbi:hypothetical protein [Rhodospirillaceae bacterium SYSU D60014]|uniref:hypothetical protein n=1 Tax=Virgifigura deserti TaxID=2268457 RepID=UPI000E6613DF